MASDRSPKGRGAEPVLTPALSELPGDRARQPGSELDLACQEQADLVLLTLVGALDTYTTPGFKEYAGRYDPAEVQLVIDLAGVSFLDSAGLSALLSLRTQADRARPFWAANDTDYGLAAFVYTRHLDRAIRVVEGLETGMVGLNQGTVSNPMAPFGGVKASGVGRAGGPDGLEEYLEAKYVALAAR